MCVCVWRGCRRPPWLSLQALVGRSCEEGSSHVFRARMSQARAAMSLTRQGPPGTRRALARASSTSPASSTTRSGRVPRGLTASPLRRRDAPFACSRRRMRLCCKQWAATVVCDRQTRTAIMFGVDVEAPAAPATLLWLSSSTSSLIMPAPLGSTWRRCAASGRPCRLVRRLARARGDSGGWVGRVCGRMRGSIDWDERSEACETCK